MDLTGKVAVITGGASGIGLACAEALAGRGARVALADVEEPALEEAVAKLAAGGAEAIGVATDVSDLSSVQALRAEVQGRLGPADILMNNAGVGGGGPTWQVPHAAWQWVLGVNLWGVIHGLETFLPGMVERDHGHVINTASLAGLVATPGMAPYTASKHAVVGISESLYWDLQVSGSGVKVSVLCPGFVKTRIGESVRNWPADRLGERAAGEIDPEFAPLVQGLIDSGIDPSAVAEQVMEAVDCGRFWILTHPELSGAITSRFERAVKGEEPEFGAIA